MTLTTRILLPAGYAVIAYVTTVANLIFTATSNWTSTAVARYGREEFDQRGTMTSTSWNRLAFTAPLLATSILVIVALKISGSFPPELTWTFVALAVASGLILIISDHITTLLEAQGRMKLTAVGLTLRQGVVVAVLVAISVSGHGRTPFFVLTLSIVALSGLALVLGRTVWKVGFWPPRFDRLLQRRMLRFSIPMIAFTASQYVIRSIDIILLRAFDSASTTGVYAVAYQGYTVLTGVANTVTLVLTPLFVSLGAADKDAVIERYLRRAVPQIIFVTAALTGVGLGFVKLLVPVVFGAAFRRAGEPLVILLVALVPYTYASFAAPIILLHERSRATGAINVVAALINVVGDLILLGPFHLGIIAPAIATDLAIVAIWAGYLLTARACTKSAFRFNPLLFAPVVTGIVPALALSPGLALAVAVTSTLVLSLAILRWWSPFGAEDADMIEKLNMPAFLKWAAHRAIALAVR